MKFKHYSKCNFLRACFVRKTSRAGFFYGEAWPRLFLGREDCCYNQAMSEAPFISAIVPTLNEESCIEECLERLELAGVEELIVVDGGSDDRTRATGWSRACPHVWRLRVARTSYHAVRHGHAHVEPGMN